MTTTNSTAYSRDLGDELRRLRQRFTGLRGRAMAIQLGWDPSKVSNIEHGKIRASAVDLAQYLTVCGKDVDFFEDFLNRYRNAFDPYLVQDPDNQRTLAMTEAAATKITAYDVISIHPLLHTPAYARAVQAATAHPLQDPVETLDRQTVMRRPTHPECTFYVHELALRIRLGDTRVMQDQYERLLAESNIVRIIPAEATSSALHPKCTLYEFENAAPLVYAESDVAKVFAQDDAAVTRCRTLFDHLEAVALNEHQTRRTLTQHVQALGAPVRALTRTQ
ncbi:helix-turn-helix domain-containing protein [Lentzea aerocolonigenes]|uniref:helix-turn-helix domain-containing protein n=1 Tax=Lentzea aerocolonigenes TaxID=68170 RepID=UPI0004C418AD|nr:helix-turn-helix transcriptional regulator [Lentzea aerocolonigenes]MCP2244145.1 Helix-turn-helix domain-containing protein [Lentzea aerocolonigenes]